MNKIYVCISERKKPKAFTYYTINALIEYTIYFQTHPHFLIMIVKDCRQ